jgi:hypothetical protein
MANDGKDAPIETTATAEAAPAKPTFLAFPEASITGDGFTQVNPETGWLWIGINLNKFSFRDAWAFITSQQFTVSSICTQREQQAMMRANLQPNAGGRRGIASVMDKIRKLTN